jgi:hypothetical protein
MFTNWKSKVATVGGLICFVITALGFFEIYAKDVLQAMTVHYIWGIAALGSFSVFVLGARQWWKNSRITPENVQSRIREWLDALSFNHRPYPWEPWHFGYEVTHPSGPAMFVARTKVAPDSLLFTTKVVGIFPPQRSNFNGLSEAEKQRFYAEIARESARAKINFFSEGDYESISITKSIPISNKLTASTFLEHVNDIHFSCHVFWATIAIWLGPAVPKPPSSTSGKEGPPPLSV